MQTSRTSSSFAAQDFATPTPHGPARNPKAADNLQRGWRTHFASSVLACIIAAGSVSASPPVLLDDINSLASALGLAPSALCVSGSTAFFSGADAIHGQELWKTDGTQAGTVMVRDIAVGSDSSSVGSIIAVGDAVFFTANDAVHGAELWKSDGTAAGTVMVKDINPGSASAGLGPKFTTNGLVFFTANDGTNGIEVWRSDGTEAGTFMVKDINPGGNSILTFNGQVMGHEFYFTANDGVHGPELWKSDGTEAGTNLVKDIRSGDEAAPFPTGPSDFVAVGDTLYFTQTDSGHGGELWKTDGTEAGTVLVKDISPGTAGSNPANKAAVGGFLLFSANDGTLGDELWRTDGTEAGTVMVKDIVPGSGGSTITRRAVAGTVCYFSANVPGLGTELWRSDGTDAGTTLVSDLTPGTGSSNFTTFGVMGDTVFFSFGGLTTGRELWKTDGTPAGTVMVKEIWPGSGASSPANFVPLGDRILFSATSGPPNSITAQSVDLWSSDGSDAGTTPILPPSTGTASSDAAARLLVGNTLYLTANDGEHGLELWRTDGSAAGTALVKDIFPGNGPSSAASFVAVGDIVYFKADNGSSGAELWRSDGTDAGTYMVRDIVPGSSASSPRDLVALDGIVYFAAAAASSSSNIELWRSDGTDAGTYMVKDILPGTLSSSPTALTVFNGRIYFSASDGTNGIELWTSDGTPEGTVMVKNISPGLGSSLPSQLKVAGENLFFTANNGTDGTELWMTDGTGAGTVMVKDIYPGLSSANISRSTAVGGTLYFMANDGTHGIELWRSDGSDSGTFLVKDITPGAGSTSGVTAMVAGAGGVCFPANDGANGIELWRSDGTDAGTCMVKDIRPGAASSSPANFLPVGDLIFFSANDGVTGGELWSSDGTGVGTFRVADLTGESGSSAPADPAYFKGRVWFTATTPAYGAELWSYVIPVPEIAVAEGARGLTNGESTVDFGVQRLGRSVERTIAISNAGEVLLKGVSLSLDGPDAASFEMVSAPPASVLAPGDSTNVTVRFTPAFEGPKHAALHITSNDPDDSPFDVALQGTGRLPVFGVISLDLPPDSTLYVNEDTGVVSIPVIRKGGADDEVGFSATATGVSATEGVDFVMPPNPHNLADGAVSLTLPVTIQNPSAKNEKNRIFTVSLSAPTGGATLGMVTSVSVCIVDTKDRVAPSSPVLTSPANNARFDLLQGQAVTVSGKAMDNKGIARVQVSLNGGGFADLPIGNAGNSPCLFGGPLVPAEGSNTIVVRSIDTSGNVSPGTSRSFHVCGPLTVNAAPSEGNISPAKLAGTTFHEPGERLSVTATANTTPEPGFVFSKWSVGGGFSTADIGASEEALTNRTLEFRHHAGLVLTAEFIPNPFAVVAGTYNGLIRGVAGPAMNGSINLVLQSAGAFSARIVMDGQDFAATGQLDTTGRASFGSSREPSLFLNRTGKPPISVELWLDLYEGARLAGVATQLEGSGMLASSNIEGDRSVFDGVSRVVPATYLEAGGANATYTVVLGLSEAQPYLTLGTTDSPQGFGFATVTLSRSGAVTIAAALPDNTRFTAGSTLTQTLADTLTCPLFSALYDRRGFVISMLHFDASQHESDFTGADTVWSRPALTGSAYPLGWTDGLFMDCEGALYRAISGQSILGMYDGWVQPDDADHREDALPPPSATGNARLTFTAAYLPSVVKAVNLGSTDVVAKLPPSDNSFSLSVARSSGAISGAFTHPSLGTKPSFQGIIYQKGSMPGGFGCFQTAKPSASDLDHGFGTVSLIGKE